MKKIILFLQVFLITSSQTSAQLRSKPFLCKGLIVETYINMGIPCIEYALPDVPTFYLYDVCKNYIVIGKDTFPYREQFNIYWVLEHKKYMERMGMNNAYITKLDKYKDFLTTQRIDSLSFGSASHFQSPHLYYCNHDTNIIYRIIQVRCVVEKRQKSATLKRGGNNMRRCIPPSVRQNDGCWYVEKDSGEELINILEWKNVKRASPTKLKKMKMFPIPTIGFKQKTHCNPYDE